MKTFRISAAVCAAVLLASFGLAGCSTTSSEASETAAGNTASAPLGGDRDAHGCIGSAGYVWSEVLSACIRPWEAGVKLLPAIKPTDGSAVLAAYVVKKDDDVEVFVPDVEGGRKLHKVVEEWAGDRMLLEPRGSGWMLTAPGGRIYRSE